MQLDHAFTVPADPDTAWTLFQDLARVAPCMPGAVLDTLDGDAFTGRVKVKVGAVQMSYRGEGRVTRDEATHTMLLDLSGSEARGSGTAAAKVTATLTADPAGTRVRVATDLDITGRPAQFGRGIMAEVGDRIVQQFATRLEALLRDGEPVATTPSATTSTTSATSATSAGAAPVPSAVPTTAGSAAVRPAAEPEAVDLGAAVLPVLLRRAAVPAAAVLVSLVVIRLLNRRSRR
ncbi:SRPBCC family protein [Streptomyces sp. SID10853]|uniref:SRPBCC family protein n=1 Tax=Streptomyces sp. SID10853 TaxID=2706028 RepID=UPI0013BFAD62|nr:SRPBCC family protein [Streptomyces sp. SID10853]NDZ77086.1 SRPBCC family protein [Streptomyces sp. SID10853]